jgi:hypothetical protein
MRNSMISYLDHVIPGIAFVDVARLYFLQRPRAKFSSVRRIMLNMARALLDAWD